MIQVNNKIMEYILGVIVSIIVQGIKKNRALKGVKTLIVVLLISLVASVMYTALNYAGLWETTAQILITAGAFYAFILSRFEK